MILRDKKGMLPAFPSYVTLLRDVHQQKGLYAMKRATFTMTQHQIDWLEQEREKTGLNKVEIVRRALDDYREVQAEKEQRQYFTPQQRQNMKIMAQMQNITETEVIRKAVDRERRRVTAKLKKKE